MNFDITGDGGIGSALFLTLLIFAAVMLVAAILGGMWRTRRGAPTMDEDDDIVR